MICLVPVTYGTPRVHLWYTCGAEYHMDIIIIIYIPYILLSVIHLIIVCAAGTLCAQDRMVWYLYEIQSG